MEQLKILLYVSFMIWKLTREHYVPQNYCTMAMMCNHSGVPVCGFEKNKNCYRMFLDECDMYEHNCDNKGEYFTSGINNCNQTSDDNDYLCDSKQNVTSTITASFKMTSTEAAIAINTTVQTLSTISNIPSCTQSDNISTLTESNRYITGTAEATTNYPTNVTNEEKNNVDKNLVISSTTTKKDNSSAKILETTTMRTNKEKSNVDTNATITSITTLQNNSSEKPFDLSDTTTNPSNLTNKEKSNKNTTELSETTLATSTIVSSSTEKISSNTTVIANVTDDNSNRSLNDPTTEDNILSTAIVSIGEELNTSSLTNQKSTEPMILQTTEKVGEKAENCDFPSYCDRPKSWLTTAKGETRDFYRIIKDNEEKKSF